MKKIQIIGLSILGFIILIAIVFILGFTDVVFTRTVGKAKQNAQREVFEQTQSYVEGKRQELSKYHHEWVMANEEDKKVIEATVRNSFANFDNDKITDPDLYSFLKNCKNN